MLQRMKSKKGFTLAELLIVVAIIAVLTAIAVPLFVGALNNAEENVEAANIRAIRGAAVEEILMNQETYKVTGTDKVTKWEVTGYVTAGGDIHDLTIKPNSSATANTGKCEKLSADEATTTGKGKKGEYKVTITLDSLTATLGS